jgi:hypothetical protein
LIDNPDNDLKTLDRKVEFAFLIDNPDNDLKTLDPKQTLEDLDEAMQTIESHKGGLNDDTSKKKTT